MHCSSFVAELRDDGLDASHHASDISISTLHICIPRCICIKMHDIKIPLGLYRALDWLHWEDGTINYLYDYSEMMA